MKLKTELLEPDYTYHVYNRANGRELLFLIDRHYLFFLKGFSTYVEPVADTFSYCLMPNHFHFLLRIKPEAELKLFFSECKDLQGFKNLEGLVSRQFSNFFNSYAKALNKELGRKGSLFMHTYKRKRLDSEIYFKKLVHYIHYNPVEAGLAERPEQWKYSSYRATINAGQTKILRDEVLEYFGGRANFIHCHEHPPLLTGIEDF